MATNSNSTPSSRPVPLLSLDDTIALYGFAVIGVGYGECDEPGCRCTTPSSTPWTYTTGLTSLGQPELVMLGPTSRAAHHVVNAVAHGRRAGELSMAPTDTTVDGLGLRIVDVPDRWVRADMSRMVAWFRHYGNRHLPVVQQLLWPDRLGHFPDEEQFLTSLRSRQPLLRDHPTTYPRRNACGPGRRRRHAVG